MINVNKLSFNIFSLLGKTFIPLFSTRVLNDRTYLVASVRVNFSVFKSRKWPDRQQTNCQGDRTCSVNRHPRSFQWQERIFPALRKQDTILFVHINQNYYNLCHKETDHIRSIEPKPGAKSDFWHIREFHASSKL